MAAGAALIARKIGKRCGPAIEQLPAEFREVITLRELEGLSYKEIADIAGVPIGTIHVTFGTWPPPTTNDFES